MMMSRQFYQRMALDGRVGGRLLQTENLIEYELQGTSSRAVDVERLYMLLHPGCEFSRRLTHLATF
jgi:hypothetical protein